MPRATIHLPNDLHHKLQKIAETNDDSLSSTICRMVEIGLMVSQKNQEESTLESRYSEIERHCFKLTIQMNTLLKAIASKTMSYSSEDFKKLSDMTQEKYAELMGISPEEL